MKKAFREGAWRYVNEDGSLGEKCTPPTDDEQRAEENAEARRKHQAKADASGQEVWWRGERFVPAGGIIPAPAPVPSKAAASREYKVVTQRDDFFAGKFEPAKLEVLINQLAADGWRVVSMTATDVSSFWGSFWAKGGGATRQELVILFEKEVA